MVTLQITAQGIDKVQAMLNPAKFKAAQREAMRGALSQAETEAKDSATRELYSNPEGARKRTGALRASYSRGHKGNVYQLAADHGKIGSNLFYAQWMEEGTKPHVIHAKHGKALAFVPVVGHSLGGAHSTLSGHTVGGKALYRGKSGKTTTSKGRGQMVFVQSVHHPGTRAYRIVELAVRQGGGRIAHAYQKALSQAWGVGI